MSGKSNQRLRVYLRQRPFITVDPQLKTKNIIDSCTAKEITIKLKNQERRYKLDWIFSEDASQLEVYNTVVTPFINEAIAGYNCTVFAYGPTGTGKTYTVFGESLESVDSSTTSDTFGIIPRVAKDLFIGLDKLFDIEYTLRISFVEIYNEEVRDLFQKNSLIRLYDDPTSKNGTYFKGLREITICTLDDFFDWLSIGQKELQTSATKNNLRSSRSHTIFIFSIYKQKYTGGEEVLEAGKLQFVDLAGSESTPRVNATDVSKKEAVNINKSIFTLGNVLKGLAHKQPHVPFRDCKLTRVLQESFFNAKTSMITTCLPTTDTLEETISALEISALARNITTNPRINVTRKLNDVYLEEELTKLKKELSATQNKLGCCITPEEYEKISEEIETHNLNRMDLIDKIRELEDFKQATSDEYRDLVNSFEITKENLEEKKQKLKDVSQLVQEQEQIVKHLEEHDTEATETVDTMFKICKTVLEDKMTYHNKYNKLQNITMRNADHAQLLINNSIEGLEKVKNSDSSYTEYLESRVILQQELINLILTEKKESISLNDDLCNKLLETSDSIGVQYADLLGSFSDKSHMELATKSFNNLQEKIQKNDGLLDNLKQSTSFHSQNKLGKSQTLQEILDQQVSKKKRCVTNFYKKLNDIKLGCMEVNNLFKKEDELDSKFYEAAMQYFTESEALNQALQKQLKFIDNKIEALHTDSESFRQEAANVRLDELTEDFVTSVQSIESDLEQTANYLLSEINGTEAQYSKIILSHFNTQEVYAKELSNTVVQAVDTSNEEQRRNTADYSKKTSKLKNAFSKIQKYVDQIDGDVNVLTQCIETENVKNRQLRNDIREQTKKVKNFVNFVVHDGDTPVKKTLNYPKMPNLVLQQSNLTTLFDESPKNAEDPE